MAVSDYLAAVVGAVAAIALIHAYDIHDWIKGRDWDAECARILAEQRARLWNEYSDL